MADAVCDPSPVLTLARQPGWVVEDGGKAVRKRGRPLAAAGKEEIPRQLLWLSRDSNAGTATGSGVCTAHPDGATMTHATSPQPWLASLRAVGHAPPSLAPPATTTTPTTPLPSSPLVLLAAAAVGSPSSTASAPPPPPIPSSPLVLLAAAAASASPLSTASPSMSSAAQASAVSSSAIAKGWLSSVVKLARTFLGQPSPTDSHIPTGRVTSRQWLWSLRAVSHHEEREKVTGKDSRCRSSSSFCDWLVSLRAVAAGPQASSDGSCTNLPTTRAAPLSTAEWLRSLMTISAQHRSCGFRQSHTVATQMATTSTALSQRPPAHAPHTHTSAPYEPLLPACVGLLMAFLAALVLCVLTSVGHSSRYPYAEMSTPGVVSSSLQYKPQAYASRVYTVPKETSTIRSRVSMYAEPQSAADASSSDGSMPANVAEKDLIVPRMHELCVVYRDKLCEPNEAARVCDRATRMCTDTPIHTWPWRD